MNSVKKSRGEIMESICAKVGLKVHYPFKCPGCGHELSARPSITMLSGENHGAGNCAHCRAYFYLRVEGGLREGTRMIATLRRYDEAPQRESLGEYDGAWLHESQFPDLPFAMDPDTWDHLPACPGTNEEYRYLGKERSGRRLDGVVYDAFPKGEK